MNNERHIGRWAVAIGILSVALAANATDFSTTETGFWSYGSFGGTSSLVDSFGVVSNTTPADGPTFDSGLIQLSETGANAPITGSLYLYGNTTSDYLEFALTGEIVSSNATSAWVIAPGTLTASGGAFSAYTTGSGGLSAQYTVLTNANGVLTGSSSSTFNADVSPAPEPASIAALGIGLVGLRRLRRRK